MKIKFLLVFFVSTISYAQITLNDMKTILKMDYDSFETFAMNKGFSFFKIDDEDGSNSIIYIKGQGEKTKYITFYKKYIDFNRKMVSYRTQSQKEYLLVKQQLKEQGFSLYETFQYDAEGVLFKSYRDKKYELTLGTGKNELNSVTYEISLKFIK
jgi:hypothetical protein